MVGAARTVEKRMASRRQPRPLNTETKQGILQELRIREIENSWRAQSEYAMTMADAEKVIRGLERMSENEALPLQQKEVPAEAEEFIETLNSVWEGEHSQADLIEKGLQLLRQEAKKKKKALEEKGVEVPISTQMEAMVQYVKAEQDAIKIKAGLKALEAQNPLQSKEVARAKSFLARLEPEYRTDFNYARQVVNEFLINKRKQLQKMGIQVPAGEWLVNQPLS